jgi:hypothetical protein
VKRGRGVWAEGALLALIFLSSAVLGARTYARAVKSAVRPSFYQFYFEPAVMTACGKGFLVAPPGRRPPVVEDFLAQRTDRLSCADLPADLRVGTEGLYQRPWRYLMTAVGLVWMVLGISWSGLAPFFGVLYGVTAMLAYAVCRLVAGRVASLLCAAALSLSPLQLANLPNLRDYAKAPFTLGLILILGALVLRSWRPRDVLALSLAYGLLMGVGLGFRGDLLIDIPPFLIAVLLFLPGGMMANGLLKAGAISLAAIGFIATGWPIIQATMVSTGSCQAHVFMLGLTSSFSDALGVNGGSYGWGLYNDEYMWATVSSYASRFRPDLHYIEFCSHEYDAASWDLARHAVTTFPADIVTRAFASMLHVLGLPFARVHMQYAGVLIAAVCVLAASVASIRLALFLLFVFAYFGGYPAIQFSPRHYFPFEFIGLVAAAFLADRAVRWLVARGHGEAVSPILSDVHLRRIVLVSVVTIATVAVPLAMLRWFQNGRAGALLKSYASASTTPLAMEQTVPGRQRLPVAAAVQRPSINEAMAALGRARARFVEAVVDPSKCRPGTTLTFTYDASHKAVDFSRTVDLSAIQKSGATRLFEPVYAGFTGVDMTDSSPACQPRVAEVNGADRFRLLLSAQLAPGWESEPQYQRIMFFR